MKKGRVAEHGLAERVGGRIREIRRQRHLTQVELARRVGIRAGPMNTIEKGRHVPSGRVLYRIARVLAVPVDDLFGSEAPSSYVQPASSVAPPVVRGETVVGSTGVAFPPAAPAATLLPAMGTPDPGAQGARAADDLARAFLALEDLCGAQKRATIPLYLPFDPTECGMEHLVARVRQAQGVNDAVVFDHFELLENAGLRVLVCDLPEGAESLSAYDRPNGNAFLLVRGGMNAERQLFRLLFELGRIYWHTQDLYASAGPPRPGAGAMDELHAARKFAALFLMPAAAVRATVRQLGIAPDAWSYELLLRIKHRFGVSAEAFAIRLEELDLLAPSVAADIKRRIRGYYAAHAHAEPDSTRRLLSPNGRIGDLLLAARARPETRAEAAEIARRLKAWGIAIEGADSLATRIGPRTLRKSEREG